jgi:hypothetical protein
MADPPGRHRRIDHRAGGAGDQLVRALWWPGGFEQWYEAHNSPGARATGVLWALAEGEVGGARDSETFILLANTSTSAASVRVRVLYEDGTSGERTFAVNPNSRFNVDVRTEFPSAVGQRFGALVESLGALPAQIVVERAMLERRRRVLSRRHQRPRHPTEVKGGVTSFIAAFFKT